MEKNIYHLLRLSYPCRMNKILKKRKTQETKQNKQGGVCVCVPIFIIEKQVWMEQGVIYSVFFGGWVGKK